MPKRTLGICVHCGVRKGRYAKGPTCEPCHHLTEAEGTAKKLGLENPRHRKWRERILAYNKLARKGNKQVDIAKMWGVPAGLLSSNLRRTSKILNMKVVGTRHLEAKEPWRPPVTNEHGVGWGVKNCTCKPCIKSRNVKRAECNRRYRLKRKQKAQQQNEPS